MNNKKLVQICYDIADWVFKAVPTKGTRSEIWLEDRRKYRANGGVNPFYNVTKSGLFLEMSYGNPNKLWTPMGHWAFTGGSSRNGANKGFEEIEQELVRLTEATVHVAGYYNPNIGEIGPMYALHKWNGQLLPEPVVEGVWGRSAGYPDDYNKVKDEWESIVKELGYETDESMKLGA